MEDEQNIKILVGKGFEYKSAHDDDIFTVTIHWLQLKSISEKETQRNWSQNYD